MFFVGIDPSITNTGVVVLDAGGEVALCLNSEQRRPKTKDKVLRYGEITRYVLKGIQDCIGNTPCFTAYENYSYDSVNLAFTIGELGGVLKLGIRETLGEIALVAPKALKKFATGRGGIDKLVAEAEAESRAIALLGKRDKTTDVCDAYFLAKYAMYANAPKMAVAADKGHPLLRLRLEMVKNNKKKGA